MAQERTGNTARIHRPQWSDNDIISIVQTMQGYRLVSSSPAGHGVALRVLQEAGIDAEVEIADESNPDTFFKVETLGFVSDRETARSLAHQISLVVPYTHLYLLSDDTESFMLTRARQRREPRNHPSRVVHLIEFEDLNRTWFLGSPRTMAEMAGLCRDATISIHDMGRAESAVETGCFSLYSGDAVFLMMEAKEHGIVAHKHSLGHGHGMDTWIDL